MTISSSSSTCIDSNIDANGDTTYDSDGVGCTSYDNYPSWCGDYDDSDFDANQMCCACGGGDDEDSGYQLVFDVTDPSMTVTVYEIPITI